MAAKDTEKQALLDDLFTYHAPSDDQIPRYIAITEAAKAFAEVIDDNCPASADRTAAVRLVQQARMTANAAIALNGKSYR
jgi:hypothetical protein